MHPLVIVGAGVVAAIGYLAAKFVPKKAVGFGAAALFLVFGVLAASAEGTDAAAMTATATTAFTAVATLCVSIGTFFVVYRIVKKIR